MAKHNIPPARMPRDHVGSSGTVLGARQTPKPRLQEPEVLGSPTTESVHAEEGSPIVV